MNYEALVTQIECLPPLLDTAQIVQTLYAEGAQNVDIVRLVRAIESDALLAANILRMINSPLYGFSKQITSVAQAVTLFGTQMVFGLVVRYSINSVIIANLRPYGASNELFNEMCHLQSVLIHEWYSRVHLEYAQFLTPLALIMESGKLVFAKEITNQGTIKEFSSGLKTSANISLYENDTFGTSSYYISGLLFEHWNFNSLYVDILKSLDYEQPNSLEIAEYIDALDVVRTAVNVKEMLTEASIKDASIIVEEIGLDVEVFVQAAKRVKSRNEKINR
ncbi:MAG: HDOD domain-containing protein [Campylobacterales bacterium]|nr:HDOD domain-containing protein [Campylobacterales bacterium]